MASATFDFFSYLFAEARVLRDALRDWAKRGSAPPHKIQPKLLFNPLSIVSGNLIKMKGIIMALAWARGC